MKIFAHRGNLDGVSPRENEPALIREALAEGFDTEIDLWEVDDRFFLGHDAATYSIDLREFDHPNVIFHLKTPFVPRLTHADAFAIDHDRYSLTLRGRLWTNHGQPMSRFAIMCAPELVGHAEPLEDFVRRSRGAAGICTDYPRQVRRILHNVE